MSKAAASNLAITLAALAIIWESLRGPSWFAWVGIAAGILLLLWLEKPRPTPLRWPLLIVILMAAVSLLVSADRQLTLAQVSRLLAGIAGFVAIILWARTRRRLILTSLVLIGFGALTAAAAPFIVQWNLGKGVPIPDVIYQVFPLLVTDAVHPNVMVSVMDLLLPLPLAYLLQQQGEGLWPLSARWTRLLLLLSLVMMGLVLLLTKSRGGYAAAAAGILSVLLIAKRRAMALLLTVLILAAGLLLIATSAQQTTPVAGQMADSSTLAFRQQVWGIAAWMIAEFPYSGVGMGAFNNVALRLYPFSNVSDPGAHNLYLQAGVDLGIPGLIAFGAILLLTLQMSISSVKRLPVDDDRLLGALCAGLLAGFIALLCHGLLDITVWGTRVFFLPWVFIALVTTVHLQVRSSALP